MITQALLNCALTAVLGEAATTVLKIIGITQNADSFIEAVKSGDPEKIIIESARLVVSLYTLKCQCFTEDTLVRAVDGDRLISELKIGDQVWAYNTETDENEAKEIKDIIITETDVIVHVRTSDGEDIATTMFHPFYVRHIDGESNGLSFYGEWVAASNLLAGDILQTIDGKTVFVEEVRIEQLSEIIDVYNLKIDDLHTYYVASGILVHNQCIINENGVKIEYYYPNDHGNPVHLHVKGGGNSTKIGPNGKPVKGNPSLSPKQQKVVNNNIDLIKKTIKKLQKEIKKR